MKSSKDHMKIANKSIQENNWAAKATSKQKQPQHWVGATICAYSTHCNNSSQQGPTSARRTDILGSPFFDVFFGSDKTADDYLDRILYQLSLSLEEHNRPGRWVINSRPLPPPLPGTSSADTILRVTCLTVTSLRSCIRSIRLLHDLLPARTRFSLATWRNKSIDHTRVEKEGETLVNVPRPSRFRVESANAVKEGARTDLVSLEGQTLGGVQVGKIAKGSGNLELDA
ncbi:hypothetical protein M5K25_022831 [Dendrobium thyrsiflorum]|uniref:Uncharacterized protein n=1 Tax=Dendrobium thyrsiflorum TaxID=117978 RepID=A0ABD0U6U7_DENTH